MPSTYAHERFGNLVLEHLDETLKKEIKNEEEVFHIGLQGPDLLFYCDPLRKNGVSYAGHDMHKMSGTEFFGRETEILEKLSRSAREAGRIYLLGVLCHFVLDAMCHVYINRYEREHGVRHAVIEGAFDRSLIAAEGRIPVEEDIVKNFHPSRRAGKIIGLLYEEQGEKIMYKSMRRFKFFHGVLRCPGDLKRNLIYAGLKVLGQYDTLRGHITTKYEDPECAESSLYLQKRLIEAVPAACRLLEAFPCGLDDELYRFDFGGKEKKSSVRKPIHADLISAGDPV
ncbi:MAG: zinc dependent phospholipase C family protein [Eubacteriales bacterium]|nr:zinc dependent phospholipase C family protein [Eubacteriales bacterium]